METMTDKIAYTKVSDIYVAPQLTVDGNDGPLIDESGNIIYADIEQYTNIEYLMDHLEDFIVDDDLDYLIADI